MPSTTGSLSSLVRAFAALKPGAQVQVNNHVYVCRGHLDIDPRPFVLNRRVLFARKDAVNPLDASMFVHVYMRGGNVSAVMWRDADWMINSVKRNHDYFAHPLRVVYSSKTFVPQSVGQLRYRSSSGQKGIIRYVSYDGSPALMLQETSATGNDWKALRIGADITPETTHII